MERYSKNTWLMDTLIHRIPKAQSNSINLARLHTVTAIIVIPVITIIGAITGIEYNPTSVYSLINLLY